MTSITIHIVPEYDDYLHGMRFYDSKEIASPRAMVRLSILCAAMSVLSFWLWDWQWPYLLVGPAMLGIIRLAIYNARKSQSRTIWKSKIANGPSDVTFDENGLTAKSEKTSAEMAWSTFEKIMESRRVFLLVYSKYGYVTIPKRAFDSEKQIDEFRTLIQSKIGQEAQ